MDNQQFNQEQNYQNQSEPYAPYQPPVEQGPVSSTKPLIFSAIGLALANSVSVAGLILSIIAKNMIATFEQYNGVTNYGKIKVAKILSKIGFIVNLIMTIFWAVYILFMIGVLIAIMLSGDGSNAHTHFATILPLIF